MIRMVKDKNRSLIQNFKKAENENLNKLKLNKTKWNNIGKFIFI